MSYQAMLHWVETTCPHTVMGEGPVGVPVVEHCGDPSMEYAALRDGVALLVSPQWAPMVAEGPDVVDHLHRRLSNAVEPLALGQGMHALQLDGDGRLQADLLVYRGEGAFFLFSSLEMAETSWQILDKYTLMDDANFHRQWEAEGVLGLAGPRALTVLTALLDHSEAVEGLNNSLWSGIFMATLNGLPCRVFRDGRRGDPTFLICAPFGALEPLARLLHDAVVSAGGRAAGRLASERARIEEGLIWHGLDTSTSTIPLEAGLRDALSYDKGCYPGQEIIARITHLGHPARDLVRLRLAGEWPRIKGTSLMLEGRMVGVITSSVTWPGMGGTEGLAFLKWGDRETQHVEVTLDDAVIEAEVQPLKGQHHD